MMSAPDPPEETAVPDAAPATARETALAFIDFCNEHGDWLTNLKLQKMLYYAQGWHLADYGVPLFPECLEAWILGPTCPEVYEEFRPLAHRPIDLEVPAGAVRPELKEFVAEIWAAYGSLSAYDLEYLACHEPPWLNARRGLGRLEAGERAISVEDMRRFFVAEAERNAVQKDAA